MEKEWEILYIKALGTIRMCLVSLVAFNISKETKMKDIINALDKLDVYIYIYIQIIKWKI